MNLLARLRHICDLGVAFPPRARRLRSNICNAFPRVCLLCDFPPCLLALSNLLGGVLPPLEGAILRRRSKIVGKITEENTGTSCVATITPGKHLLPPLQPAARLFPRCRRLKLLLLLEEHREADDGAVDQETANDRHEHGWDLNEARVCEDDREDWDGKSVASSAINPCRTRRGIFP